MQIEGLDYLETFAATSIPPSWRVILALAAWNDWEVEQIDFIGAFLNSTLKETIYMEIPEGFTEFYEDRPKLAALLAKHGYKASKNQVILLRKSLYGLKQGPREWQDALKDLLKKKGYTPLVSDPAIFYNKERDTYIITYVDDCLIIGADLGYIQRLKKELHKTYPIEDRGPAAFFLGVQIIRDRENRTLTLHQSQYIEEALKRFNLEDSKPATIPIQPGTINQQPTKALRPKDHKLYQQIIGTLMYLMLLTRADIAFSIQWLSTALAQPYIEHLNASKNLLRYLKGTKTASIIYKGKKEGKIGNSLIGFSDSDFAGDKKGSKSTWAYLFKLAGAPISWKSKRASTIALSTLEAESDALCEALRELQWILGLFKEGKIPSKLPIQLYCDNQGAITTAYDPALHSRTKHTLLKFNYIRQQILEGGQAKVTYIDTNRMPADGLTKALSVPKHQAFLRLIGIY